MSLVTFSRTTGPNWFGSPLRTIWAVIFCTELHNAIGINVKASVELSHSSTNRWVKWFESRLAWAKRPDTVSVDTTIRYLQISVKHGSFPCSKFEFSKRSSLVQDLRTDAAYLKSIIRWSIGWFVFSCSDLQSNNVVMLRAFCWNQIHQSLGYFITNCIWIGTNQYTVFWI